MAGRPRLEPTESAALLLPVPAGRVGSAAIGNHPRNTVSPLFVVVPAVGTPADAALSLICCWVCNPSPGVTARLAPPVIDVIGHSRSVEDYGLVWPLPPADGV